MTDPDPTLENLVEVICAFGRHDSDDITPECKLSDLGFIGSDLADLLSDVRREFEITFPRATVKKLSTVADLHAAISTAQQITQS